jgi:hypothetical protein
MVSPHVLKKLQEEKYVSTIRSRIETGRPQASAHLHFDLCRTA